MSVGFFSFVQIRVIFFFKSFWFAVCTLQKKKIANEIENGRKSLTCKKAKTEKLLISSKSNSQINQMTTSVLRFFDE